MKLTVHPASERGGGSHGWLETRHSFSFADWYEPTKMGFGLLRVLNDDTITPDTGFGTHAHRDMEIITIVTKGEVTHEDSMGNIGTVPAGDVQVMSAGTGVKHSERNASADTPLSLFQIWIEPKLRGIEPRYAQKSFAGESDEGLTLLAAPTSQDGALTINQDAYIYRGVLNAKNSIHYTFKNTENGVYIFVIEGAIHIGSEVLGARDALGIEEVGEIEITSPSGASVLIIEVPMH
ncbi:MAG: pirin family protein [Patescibacteria group bacterium]